MGKKDYRAPGLNVYIASDSLPNRNRKTEKSPKRGHFPVLTFHIIKEIGKLG